MNKGLIIRSPWVDLILEGKKTWEIRGSKTHYRGKIYLIKGGSKTILGTCNLVDCIGPLTLTDIIKNQYRHYNNKIQYYESYAWVLKDPHKFRLPVPYDHPQGAIVWVNLPDKIRQN